jgi:ribonuclease inhibitor
MNITLDCTLITDDQTAHDVFAQALSFPASYGRNLDALYDLLSTCPETELTLTNVSALGKLFRYGDNLLLAVKDAARDNPNLTLILED